MMREKIARCFSIEYECKGNENDMSHIEEAQTIERLINTLSARLGQTRTEAADALIHLGEPAVEPLMDAIRNTRFGYHYLPEAVRALGSIGDKRAVDLLIDILASDHVHAAQEAAKALGHIGDPRAVEPLIHVFRHDWDDTETITAWQEASTALAAIGQAALPALRTALKDESSMVREGVIDALGQLKDAQVVPDLISMLRDDDRLVRATAAEALGQIGEQQAIEPLVALLTDKDSYVRQWTCYALGDLAGVSVFDALVGALSDPDPDVRSAAVVNLGRIDGMTVPALDPEPEPERRRAAIESLKRAQGERILDLLLEALQDSAGAVRAAAAGALGQLGDARALPMLYWIQQNDMGYAGANKVSDSAARAIQFIQARYQKR
jgi:HEAT repeat protein